MKLKIDKFERLAKDKGYRNGYELSLEIGCGELTYGLLKQGHRVGSDIVAELYNRFGSEAMLDVIDFEGDTLDDFTNKYVRVGTKLY